MLISALARHKPEADDVVWTARVLSRSLEPKVNIES